MRIGSVGNLFSEWLRWREEELELKSSTNCEITVLEWFRPHIVVGDEGIKVCCGLCVLEGSL